MPEAHSVSTIDKTIRLHDGRTLGYAEYGTSQGRTLFYFHGHPGSRLEARFLAEQSEGKGIRLIGVDRPGMGLSSFKAGRRLLDWPVDVCELADPLHIERFSVVGYSGGGPYSLACAYKVPERLVACGIIAGVGHTGPLLSFLAQWLPWLLLPIVARNFRNQERAEQSLARFSGRWIEPDRKSLIKPGIQEIMAESLVEAMRQGTKGIAYDGTLLGRSWGFALEEITFPAIYLWHGELDKQVPVAMGRPVAARLAHCLTTYYREDGHISIIVNHREEILKALMFSATLA